ncbi:hypothetical protein BDN72DRAFT_895509 [Pluteus cervinus]|uniref:Uncharacterized protein n=1 Tax=Pluteus cervinus TaxID=181527 RepID=A0ACD3B086_9AGAR|nr:hypothetical protein BDN72DRAFT_895509 [Pluteus cervinus]
MPLWRSPDHGGSNSPQWLRRAPHVVNGTNQAPSSPLKPSPSSSATRSVSVLPTPVTQQDPSGASRPANRRKSARIAWLSVYWASFKKRMGGTIPSSSSFIGDSIADGSTNTRGDVSEKANDDEDFGVDEVVVDRVWSEELKSSATSDPGGEKHSYTQNPRSQSEPGSLEHYTPWQWSTPFFVLRWRVWPKILYVFKPRFADDKAEYHYAQEDWFLKKPLAGWASLWLIANWVLGCTFVPKPLVLMDKIFYFGVAPAFSLPIGLMVLYDWPRDRMFLYQLVLIISVWIWPFYQILFMFLCGFYPGQPSLWQCGMRDFLGASYYTTALQTIALFGLKLNRFPAAIGATTFFVFTCIAMIPFRLQWTRTMINFAIYHIFLLYVHYIRESSERRLFTLRDQLKVQYRATQKAQINERQAAESKRRLTSLVRVPLNTALLAVQNMAASGTVAKEQEIEFNALEGSLSMMSKVLNDVLDFHRMDSGKFESVSRPYAFHQVMRSSFIPLQLATDARGLKFITDLDPKIDRIARRATYEALGQSSDTIARHLREHPNRDGIVTGDEVRLRQIVNNLASNACKFTPSGGTLTVTTRLVLPVLPEFQDGSSHAHGSEACCETAGVGHHRLSHTHLSLHDMAHSKPKPVDNIVVRVEVTDTGYGIRRRDLARNKLFSAFNQTEQGRRQGGKGTGLGLALVRQIVKLSGGRLGVRSKIGEGSTFWVELPLGIGRRVLATAYGGDGSPMLNLIESQISNSDSKSIPAEIDEFSMKAASASTPAPRSSAALHGLMEQAGRVELRLQKYDASDGHFRDLSTSSTQQHHSSTQEEPISPPLSPRSPLSVDPPSPPAGTMKARSQRPTFVALPSPKTFAPDSRPTPPLSNHSNTDSFSSALAMFDQSHARGSPSSSNHAVNYEPGLSVLVVDDDSLTRTLMQRILTRLGCHVTTAENGEVALELILGPPPGQNITPSSDSGKGGPILERATSSNASSDSPHYAVVFLDNQMPVLSGVQAVERLREMGRTDFVVGVTGNALLTDQKEYLEAGVDRVLTKPVLERSLRDILAIADERWRQKHQPMHSPSGDPS